MASAVFFDSPNQVLDCAQIAIPGKDSPTLEVIASLPFTIRAAFINDAVAAYVGIYSGAIGQEQLVGMICSGKAYTVPLSLEKGARVSLRSMSASAISTGSLCVTFLSLT